MPHHPVPDQVPKPHYYESKGHTSYSGAFQGVPQIQPQPDILRLRRAAKVAADTLQTALKSVRVGMTTEDVDKIVHDFIISQGAYPAPIYYQTFPKSVCTSVNEGNFHLVVCHGIPNLRPLEDGDTLNIDVTVYIDSVYGDTSDMALVGTKQHPDILNLISATREAVQESIKICKPGVKVSAIGEVCERVAKKRGVAICGEFAGHGIGREMHMPPPIVHCRNSVGFIMVPGMVFTIEPIFIMRQNYDLAVWKDNWTVVDKHLNPSAQCEHMVLITNDGCEVLTKRE